MEIENYLENEDSFESLSLSKGLLSAITSLSFSSPTSLQCELIPLSKGLNGKLVNHYVIEAPGKSGKTSAGLMAGIERLLEKGKGVPMYLVVLCASRTKCMTTLQLTDSLSHFLNGIKSKTILDENLIDLNLDPTSSYVLVSTPMRFLSFFRNSQIPLDSYVGFIVDDIDYSISFGFKGDLISVFETITADVLESKLMIFSGSTCTKEGSETLELKKSFLRHSATLRMEGEEIEVKTKKETLMRIPQYYYVGSESDKFIVLFILTRLKFISGKTLIITADLDECYKVKLFLERCGVKGSSIYNRKDPKSFKAYTMSNFNTGLTSILISTKEVLKEGKTISHRARDKQFRGISNILIFSAVLTCEGVFGLFEHVKGQFGCIVGFYSSGEEKELELLDEVMDYERELETQTGLKELPLKYSEITAFNYRIKDLLSSISRKQIKASQIVDLQKQIIKSKNLAEYFGSHASERDLLSKSVISKQAFLNKFAIRMYDDIPEYLLPAAVKEKYKSEVQAKRFIEIKRRESDSFAEGLKKRAEANGLSIEDVKKDVNRNKSRGAFKLDLRKEDPLETDVNDLLPVSGRKLWKMKHRKAMQKRNPRMEKKGIFTT